MLIFGFVLLPLFLIIQLLMKARKNRHKPRTVAILHTIFWPGTVVTLQCILYSFWPISSTLFWLSIDILIASVYRCIFAMKSAIVLVFSLLICIFQSRNMSTVQDIEKDFHGMSLGREVWFKGHIPIFLRMFKCH